MLLLPGLYAHKLFLTSHKIAIFNKFSFLIHFYFYFLIHRILIYTILTLRTGIQLIVYYTVDCILYNVLYTIQCIALIDCIALKVLLSNV